MCMYIYYIVYYYIIPVISIGAEYSRLMQLYFHE